MAKRAPTPVLKKLNFLYNLVSHPYTFLFVILVLLGWFIAGSLMHFDEHWYKNFHVFEIVVALLMVFLIESSSHADNRAIQEKLDEIIEKMPQADNKKMGLEQKYKGGK